MLFLYSNPLSLELFFRQNISESKADIYNNDFSIYFVIYLLIFKNTKKYGE